MWCFFSDTRAPTFCVALPNLVYLCYILLLKIYFPQNKKEIGRNLDISVPVFNSFSYSMRSISSRHTLVMHAVPSELQAAHEEGKIKYLRREEVKKKQKKKQKHAWSHWLSQPKQLVASLPQQSVTLRRSRLAQVQDWFGEGGGVLIMTQRQSLNQPSLSMLISSILFLMNWLACERTGGNYSNWGEWQEQGRGWGRGEVCCEWAGWMKGGCVCLCVWWVAFWVFSSRQSNHQAWKRHTLCGSLYGTLSETNNSAVKPLFSSLLWKVWQKAEDKREHGRRKERCRIRRYHGGVIKKAESGGEMLCCYHWHLRSLWFPHFTSLWTAISSWQ